MNVRCQHGTGLSVNRLHFLTHLLLQNSRLNTSSIRRMRVTDCNVQVVVLLTKQLDDVAYRYSIEQYRHFVSKCPCV